MLCMLCPSKYLSFLIISISYILGSFLGGQINTSNWDKMKNSSSIYRNSLIICSSKCPWPRIDLVCGDFLPKVRGSEILLIGRITTVVSHLLLEKEALSKFILKFQMENCAFLTFLVFQVSVISLVYKIITELSERECGLLV